MSQPKRRMFIVDWVTLVAIIVMMGFLIYYFIIKMSDAQIMSDLMIGAISFITVFVVLGIITCAIFLVKWLTDREKKVETKKVEVNDEEVVAVISAAVAASMGKARQARPEFVVREYKSIN